MQNIERIERKADIAVLAGQTATGKTGTGILIAKALDAEIISADSVQIYRGMNIGSAKPTSDEMNGVRHHMIDIADPRQDSFTVSEFQRMAFDCIEEIKSRGKRVLVVGGTGLYIQSLCDYMEFAEIGQDSVFRSEWVKKERSDRGIAHRELKKVDPEAAERIHENDLKRTIRALEIAFNMDRSKYDLNREDEKKEPRFKAVQAGLTMDRARLYERINLRVEKMLKDGLIDEVRSLLESGVPKDARAMQALGYKEIVEYIDDRVECEDAIEGLKQGTRRFAKRQNTWFKRDFRIKWYDIEDYEDQKTLADDIIEYYLSKI